MGAIQAVFQEFYPAYRQAHTPSAQQASVAKAIMICRTKAMGDHVRVCEECGHFTVHHNSCRNRHCPSCQGVNQAVWVDARNRDVVNAPYFHVVFTMPSELQALIYQNQEQLYPLMYQTVAETLLELSKDPKYLGAQLGFFSLLHTWGQDLHYHPHIHTVIMAGGLTGLKQWRYSSKDFFIPVKVLAKKFRGKYLHYLKRYYHQGRLNFYGKAGQYDNPGPFYKLLGQCYGKDWYVYTKRTFSGPQAVVQYLGRYTHRIAIANSRIVSMDEDTVTFTVRDRKNPGKSESVTLAGSEFIRRFLMHILPKGFVKIRYYGILANRNQKTKLALCKKLTSTPVYPLKFAGLTTIEIVSLLSGRDLTLCPACQEGRLAAISTHISDSGP